VAVEEEEAADMVDETGCLHQCLCISIALGSPNLHLHW